MTRRCSALTVAVIALGTDMLVYGIAVPVLPAIVGGSGAGVGLLFAAYAAALIAATPLVGRWVDRRGFRTPMVVGLAGLAAATLLFAAFDDLPILIAGRAAQGAAAAVTWTASLSLIAAAYPPAERGKPMGIALSAVGIGTLAGPPVGGLLFEHVGRAAPFVFATALAAGDGLARWLLVRDPPRQTAASAGYRALATDRRAPALIALTGLGAFTLAFMEPILPLHLADELGAGAATVGLVFGGATLASSFVAPSFGAAADRFPKAALALAGATAAAAGMVALPLVSSVGLSALALAVVAVGGALVLVPTLSLIGELAESAQPPIYGAAFALYTLAYATGLTVAPLVAGFSAEAAGFESAAFVAAGGCLGAAVACALVLLRAPGRSPAGEVADG